MQFRHIVVNRQCFKFGYLSMPLVMLLFLKKKLFAIVKSGGGKHPSFNEQIVH